MRLLLLTLTLVGTRLEAVVVVETSLRAPRTVVAALASVSLLVPTHPRASGPICCSRPE